MILLIGLAVVFVAVILTMLILGESPAKLIQPAEFVAIGGIAAGAYIASNNMHVVKSTPGAFIRAMRGSKYHKEQYLELLSLQYQTFKLAKAKGMLALEGHVEHPDDSNLFAQFPNFASNRAALTFLCDYLRLLTLGTDNPNEVETLIDEELETQLEEELHVQHSIQWVADACPAIGIIAAVLGVIHTMSLISEPVEVIGAAIAAALTGTLLGIFLGYGVFGPIANALKSAIEADMKYYRCIRAGLLAYMQGYAPAVCVEFARKTLSGDDRPTFYEVEEATQSLPPI